MKKKILLSLPIGIFISALALYLSFRRIPIGELISYLREIDYIWVLPTILLVGLAFVLRVFRWQLILNTSENVTYSQAYHPLMIGFMLNCILPGRVGEAARPLILAGRNRVPFSTGIATVATERLLDGIFLIAFLAIALGTVPMDGSFHISFGKYQLDRATLELLGTNFIILCVLLLGGIVMLASDRTRDLLKKGSSVSRT
jgi:glycosyltransferase 2 family protein